MIIKMILNKMFIPPVIFVIPELRLPVSDFVSLCCCCPPSCPFICVTGSEFSFLRGHTVKAVCESFHLAKDSGFKVVAHMMPDLPNVGLERDIEQFTVSVDPNQAA